VDRVVRQWERTRDRYVDAGGADWERLLAEEALNDLDATLEELTAFLEGGAGTLDRDRVRAIDEACTELGEVRLELGEDPGPDRRADLETRGDEIAQRLEEVRDKV
jgi:hypothetical protein